MRKMLIGFLSLFAISATAGVLTVPTSVNLDYDPSSQMSERTFNVSITNDTTSSQTVENYIGNSRQEIYKISSNCSCSLTAKRYCQVKFGVKANRTAQDYVIQDSFSIDGQIIPINVTVKAIVPVVNDPVDRFTFKDGWTAPRTAISSIDFGTITSPTMKVIEMYNDTGKDQAINYILPSGVRIVPNGEGGAITNCPATLLASRTCYMTLELSPMTCAGGVYNRELKISGQYHSTTIPMTADFTGATTTLCIP